MLLKSSGKSYTHANANNEIKAYCDAVTTDCEHNGVATAIFRYVLQ